MSDASLQPILALVGFPVAGNPTQYMMEKAFAQHGLDCRFLTLEVAPDALGDAVRGMGAMNFLGGICADPHKHAVLAHLARTAPTAEIAGVVNCLARDGNELVGENTEGRGLVRLLQRAVDPAGKPVVLVGAGNVARSVAVELAQCKPSQITVVDRTESRAVELVELLTGKLQANAVRAAWEGEFAVAPETALVIHATSIGREDDDALVPLKLASLRPEMIVADVTFNPPRTRLLVEAQRIGCTTIDGLDMFVEQTALCLQRWTGVDPDRNVMREAVEEFLLL